MELERYLSNRFIIDNELKYHKYFSLWYKNLVESQIYYFNLDMVKSYGCR